METANPLQLPATAQSIFQTATVAHWRIEMLGTLRAVRVGSLEMGGGGSADSAVARVLTRFQTTKTASLLTYLALHIPKSVHRETLADLIWPDADPPAARNSLRVALNSLRRQLEPPGLPPGAVLSADRTVVSLSRRLCQTDVVEFEELLRRERSVTDDAQKATLLRQAVALYRGDLLDGWSDTWLLSERARFAELCLNALKQIVRLSAQAGDYETSLAHAQRALDLDPLREGAHRDLMRLYVALKRPEAALRQYDDLERRLNEDLGVAPSQASREMAAQIIRAGGNVSSDALPLAWEGSGNGDASAASPTEKERAGIAAAPVALATGDDTATAADAAEPVHRAVGMLPLAFTRFFGRETEQARLAEMAAPVVSTSSAQASEAGGTTAARRPRCISISGPAGIGKTRLAMEVCYRLRDAYAERIWFVPLSDLEEPGRLAVFVTNALGAPPSSVVATPAPTAADGSRAATTDNDAASAIVSQIVGHLAGEPALLVLDNVEHLLHEETTDLEGEQETTTLPFAALAGDGVAHLLQTLLARLPNLILILTTRRRLEIESEQELSVAPLPAPGTSQSPADLMRYASIQLFLDRAQSVRPDFQLTTGNAEAVAALCARLEGIPLAIELAAAWATALTPAQMLDRLARRFDLLVSRRRDRSARHLTLRAALDYSYELLPSNLKRFFRQITVFRGGMSLEAAEEIAQSLDALEMLTQLQQRSLLLTEEVGAAMRFRLLETLREYGWERLTTNEQSQLEEAHTGVFARFAEGAANQLVGPNSDLYLRALDGERENLRVTLERLLARAETGADTNAAGSALRLCQILWRFWYSRGYVTEGLRDLERALRLTETAPHLAPHRAEAMEGAGRLSAALGDYARAETHFAQRMMLLRAQGDSVGIETTLFNLCLVSNDAGDRARARQYLNDLLNRTRESGKVDATAADRWLLSSLLHDLAQVTDDNIEAVALLQECLQLCRVLDARWHSATVLDSLTDATTRRIAALPPDSEEKAALQMSADTYRTDADELRARALDAATGASYLNLGDLSLGQGDYPTACEMLSEALSCFQSDRDASYEAIARERLCVTSLRQRDPVGAGQYAQQALRIRRTRNDLAGVAYCERLLSASVSAPLFLS